jgi:hypothetical protein
MQIVLECWGLAPNGEWILEDSAELGDLPTGRAFVLRVGGHAISLASDEGAGTIRYVGPAGHQAQLGEREALLERGLFVIPGYASAQAVQALDWFGFRLPDP